jgi:Icc-related predicted phosphoesterase
MSVQEIVERPLFSEELPLDDGVLESVTAPDGIVARFDRPRAASPTTLAVLSDPHVATDASGSWKLYHRTRDRFRETVAALEGLDVDALVIAGDLTKDGEEADLKWVRAALDDLDVPVLAVPGNHDVKAFDVAHFEDRFADGGFPIRLHLDGVDLIGLDSTVIPDEGATADGVVSEDQLDRLERILPETTDPIVVMHHNLPGLGEQIGEDGWEPHPPVGNADALLEVLSRHDVPLHLSGHVHLLSLTLERGVRGLIAPPLSSFPQACLLLDIDETGTTVRCHSAASKEAIEEAYGESQTYSERSRVISWLNARQLGSLPLLDERGDAPSAVDPICPLRSDD